MPVRSRTAAVAVVLAVAALTTACSGGPHDAAPSTTANRTSSPAPVESEPATPAADPTSTDRSDLTEAALGETWSDTSEADKDALCEGLDLFGTAWVARQMREDQTDENVDWNYAALLVEEKCNARP